MIFVEPAPTYFQRARQRNPQNGSREHLPPQQNDFWIEIIFDTLRGYGDLPIRFTSLVNTVARTGNFSRRDDREAQKIELFRLVGKLIRLGHLDRCDRKYVTLPKSDARRQALLASVPSIGDLPRPEL